MLTIISWKPHGARVAAATKKEKQHTDRTAPFANACTLLSPQPFVAAITEGASYPSVAKFCSFYPLNRSKSALPQTYSTKRADSNNDLHGILVLTRNNKKTVYKWWYPIFCSVRLDFNWNRHYLGGVPLLAYIFILVAFNIMKIAIDDYLNSFIL